MRKTELTSCNYVDGLVCQDACFLRSHLANEGLVGGAQTDGKPAGSVWKISDWIPFGIKMVSTAKQVNCADQKNILTDYGRMTLKKFVEGNLRLHSPSNKG